jgi:hypothetical protein
MFHSIKDAWLSASKNNMADVKELIPEFFYLPEMFENANNFDFGTKQSGIVLDDVRFDINALKFATLRSFCRLGRTEIEKNLFVSINK